MHRFQNCFRFWYMTFCYWVTFYVCTLVTKNIIFRVYSTKMHKSNCQMGHLFSPEMDKLFYKKVFLFTSSIRFGGAFTSILSLVCYHPSLLKRYKMPAIKPMQINYKGFLCFCWIDEEMSSLIGIIISFVI